MKLMKVTLLTALRNEEQIIYKWDERSVWLNPRNVESMSFIDEIGKAQVLLTSGRSCPVKECLEDLAKIFEEATK